MSDIPHPHRDHGQQDAAAGVVTLENFTGFELYLVIRVSKHFLEFYRVSQGFLYRGLTTCLAISEFSK